MISFKEYISENTDIVGDKMTELNSVMYSDGCHREKRIDGYICYPESSRKVRYIKTSDKKNFYVEVVNKSDESFVAEIGDCMSKDIQEIIELIKEY